MPLVSKTGDRKLNTFMKIKEDIKAVKKVIKLVEIDSGVDKCKGYNPDCANCKSQLLLGYLEWYLDLLEWTKDKLKVK